MINNRVREIRKEQGITQAALAKKVGITRPYLSDIENCKRQVSGEVMLKIARNLQMKVEEIFFAGDVHHDEQVASGE